MKKFRNIAAVCMLSGAVMLSSCVGSFSLSKKVLDWNQSVGDQWVNELVFIVCNVIPVYEVSMFIDGVVLNTIEFWTGSNPVAANQTKTVKGQNGEYMIVSNENGYSISNGQESVELVYNQENNSWNMVSDDATSELIRFNENGTATLPNGKTVSLNAAGVMAARQSAQNGYVAIR